MTHSSGNHAQALALAAQLLGIRALIYTHLFRCSVTHLLGIRALIVMPSNAPSIKRNAVLGYGTN
ncbi:MAG: hypothetical protein ACXVHS_09160 [Methanobacterium sp.]